MKIVVDAGNTNIKIGYFKKNKLIKFLNFPKGQISKVSLYKTNQKINGIYIGSVVPSINKSIVDRLSNFYKVRPTILTNQMFAKHLDLSPFDINEIGSDILATALYIKNNLKKAVGFSFGTANYAVAVNNKKIYGVMITPSLDGTFGVLDQTTELTKTNKFESKNKTYNYFGFGTDTKTALTSGFNHLTKGWIDSIMIYASQKYKINKACVCGGKSNLFSFLNDRQYVKKITKVQNCVLLGYYELVK